MKEGDEIAFEETPLTDQDVAMFKHAILTLKNTYSKIFNKEISKIESAHLDELLPYFKKGIWWSKKKREASILILGTAYGQMMVDSLGFEWVVYKDKIGEEYAIRHIPSNWRAFPFSSVSKRIKTREKGYFTGLYNSFKNSIEEKERESKK